MKTIQYIWEYFICANVISMFLSAFIIWLVYDYIIQATNILFKILYMKQNGKK